MPFVVGCCYSLHFGPAQRSSLLLGGIFSAPLPSPSKGMANARGGGAAYVTERIRTRRKLEEIVQKRNKASPSITGSFFPLRGCLPLVIRERCWMDPARRFSVKYISSSFFFERASKRSSRFRTTIHSKFTSFDGALHPTTQPLRIQMERKDQKCYFFKNF